MRMLRCVLLCLLVVVSVQAEENVNFTNCEDSSPQVFAPADVVVSCCYWFSLGMLDDPNNAAFGRFVYGQSNIRKLKTNDKVCPSWCEYDRVTGYDPDDFNDGKACELANRYYSPSHPDRMHGLVWGWDGYAENWTSAVTIEIDDRRKCGTGLIRRRFIIEDRGIKYYDDQEIWILDCDPFYVSDDCTDTEDDIEWPLFCQQPDPLDGCFADLSPSNPDLGRPKVVNGADNQCNLISIDYVDDTLTVEPDACLKVIRTWTVVDWCRYHPLRSPNEGRWDYVQIIKVRDKLDPEIECIIGDCNPASKDSTSGSCVGYIELTAIGVDSCTKADRLRYEYKIDLFNDGQGKLGDFDLQVGPLSRIGESPTILNNEFAEIPDDVLNASGTYPIGTHRVKWFVEDGCGNVSLCDTTFTILDCKAPTPYCKPGIITVVMPSTQMIDVWASDLDDGSFDNCTDELIFSFSADTSDQSRTYDCDSLGVRTVNIWVTDEEGNQDFCKTKIEIQDSQGSCDSSSTLNFGVSSMMNGGKIVLDKLYLRVYADGAMYDEVPVQSAHFKYNFSQVSGMIEVELVKKERFNDNGVTTQDLLALFKHLLAIKSLSHYSSIWAGDINQDGELSSKDISMLRKILVLEPTKWPTSLGSNYLFAPENAVHFDTNKGLKNPKRHLIQLSNPLQEYIFRPVKVGDIQ